MLNQLIESKSHQSESRRRGGFLLTTFTAVVSLFSITLLYSLFTYNLAMAGENLELSTLVAPVEVSENVPEPPKTDIRPDQQNPDKSAARQEIRRVNMQSVDEVPVNVPDVSTAKNPQMARPQGKFSIGPVDVSNSSGSVKRDGQFSGGGDGSGLDKSLPEKSEQTDVELPPVMKPPVVKKPATTIVRTSRILNGEAKYLAKPPYPQPAKLVHASGAVNVQVTIDESGNIIAANAVSGHPLLRQVSEQAARSSKFNPTILNDQKVKVTGVIVYNFIPQ